jgi:hypothetical protein
LLVAAGLAHVRADGAAAASAPSAAVKNARNVAFVDSGESLARAVAAGVMHIVVTVDLDLSSSVQSAASSLQGLSIAGTTKSIRVRTQLGSAHTARACFTGTSAFMPDF